MPAFDDGLAETEVPTGTTVSTDVLIVGSGPAGGAAALCLSTLQVPNIMITKYRWTANTPRAHITNQRAMEIFRDLGVEDQVLADATPRSRKISIARWLVMCARGVLAVHRYLVIMMFGT